jgi:hypothetical protein
LGFKVKKFIFRYSLMVGIIAATSIAITMPAQSQPDSPMPVCPQLQQQQWKTQSLIAISLLAISGCIILSQGKMRSHEKAADHKVGEDEAQRHAYGEKNFNLLTKEFGKHNKSSIANVGNVTKRVNGLVKFMPKALAADIDESENIFKKIARQILDKEVLDEESNNPPDEI